VSHDPKQMRPNIGAVCLMVSAADKLAGADLVCSLEIFIEVTKLPTPYLGMT